MRRPRFITRLIDRVIGPSVDRRIAEAITAFDREFANAPHFDIGVPGSVEPAISLKQLKAARDAAAREHLDDVARRIRESAAPIAQATLKSIENAPPRSFAMPVGSDEGASQ